MTKEFERRVIREGTVDTKKYRYVYGSFVEGTCIKRIERSRIDDSSLSFDDWEIVKDYTQPRGLHYANKKFDIYSMRGRTAKDDKALMEYINKDMNDLLFVDDAGAVFDADDNYVANCIEGDPGDGICC